MINKMSSHVILNIFCDFSLERDGATDRPTDRASYRGAVMWYDEKGDEEMVVEFLCVFF